MRRVPTWGAQGDPHSDEDPLHSPPSSKMQQPDLCLRQEIERKGSN